MKSVLFFLSKALATREFGPRNKAFEFYEDTGVNWFEATKLCYERGGELAHFDDPYDHLYAMKTIPASAKVWIGYSDLGNEGNWLTVRNEPAEYVRWASSEPDNRNGLEHCGILVMGPWGRGRFVDGDCESTTGIAEWTQPVHVLCRFDGPKPPPPTKSAIELEVMAKLGIPLPTTTTTADPTLPSWAQTTTTTMTTPEVAMNNPVLDPQLIDDLESTKAKLAENSSKVSKILLQLDNQDRELKMIGSVTSFLKEDNAKIFNHLEEIIKNKPPQPATEEEQGSGDDTVEGKPTSEAPVVIQSSAASKEQELFMQQQMELNQKLLKKLEKQKELINEIRAKSKSKKSQTVSGATGFQISQAVELALQEERSKNGNLERTVQQLKAKLMTFENQMSEVNNILLEYKQRKG